MTASFLHPCGRLLPVLIGTYYSQEELVRCKNRCTALWMFCICRRILFIGHTARKYAVSTPSSTLSTWRTSYYPFKGTVDDCSKFLGALASLVAGMEIHITECESDNIYMVLGYTSIDDLVAASNIAARPAESGSVTTHVSAIHANIVHFTREGPKADQLTNITAPT